MTSNVSKKKSSVGYTILYAAIVVLAAQLSVNLFTTNFVISAGVIVFALLMLLVDEFAAMPIVFLSAAGVMVTRSIASAGHIVNSTEIWNIGMPEFVFYIVFGVLIYLLYNYAYAGRSYPMLFVCLVVPDFAANIAELYIRVGSEIGNGKTILILLLIAVLRATVVLIIYQLIIHYGVRIVRMPRSGIEVVDGKAKKVQTEAELSDGVLEEAAADARALHHKLENSSASAELAAKAGALADEIEKVLRRQA